MHYSGACTLTGMESHVERFAKLVEERALQGARVSIPTETMEQEFALHNRRGYSDGYKAAKHQASIELAAMRAQLDAALSAMSGMAALQANPPMNLLTHAESFEAGRVMEREAMVAEAAKQGWAMKNEDPFEDSVRDIADICARKKQ